MDNLPTKFTYLHRTSDLSIPNSMSNRHVSSLHSYIGHNETRLAYIDIVWPNNVIVYTIIPSSHLAPINPDGQAQCPGEIQIPPFSQEGIQIAAIKFIKTQCQCNAMIKCTLLAILPLPVFSTVATSMCNTVSSIIARWGTNNWNKIC